MFFAPRIVVGEYLAPRIVVGEYLASRIVVDEHRFLSPTTERRKR